VYKESGRGGYFFEEAHSLGFGTREHLGYTIRHIVSNLVLPIASIFSNRITLWIFKAKATNLHQLQSTLPGGWQVEVIEQREMVKLIFPMCG